MSASPDNWEAVIGLEVHCQLKTATKLFCNCANEFGGEPNSRTCPVCTGQPGALPVLNREALGLGVRVALALGCDVAARSKFDRKNYFYCDLPKGYQISQFDVPYCTGGGIDLADGKRVRLVRIHLEEDAGKAIHDRGTRTLVDLNRAGVPLLESVTEPDLSSADEAWEYLTELKSILQYVGASDCDMEKGSLRCDVNVSVRPRGEAGLRTKVELKNLNSFANVKAAIECEIERQVAAYEAGDEAGFPVQETRSFDPDTRTTHPMRGKEDAHDYRYFPEPDLPAVTAPPELIEHQRALLPELPRARRKRYVEELGLSEYDAGVLTAARDVADFFERAAELAGAPKDVANWVANDLLAMSSDPELGGEGFGDLRVRPQDVADLVGLVRASKVSKSAGKKVLRGVAASGRSAADVVAELGLEQVDDASAIETWCRDALAGQDAIIADIRAGKHKAIGALMGPIMKASKGSANPQRVRETILRLIEEEYPG